MLGEEGETDVFSIFFSSPFREKRLSYIKAGITCIISSLFPRLLSVRNITGLESAEVPTQNQRKNRS